MRYIIIILALSILSSCGMFKKTNKHIAKSEVVSVVKRDCVTVATVEAREADRTTTENEKTTTINKKAPGKKVIVGGELKSGLNVFSDSLGRQLIAVFDTLSREVQIVVDVPEVEETTTTTERTNEKKDTEKHEIRKDTAILRDERNFSQKQSEVIKESKPDYTWIIYVFGVIALVVIGILIYRKFKKRLLW